MKHKIMIISFILSLLMVLSVFAISTPLPINGRIESDSNVAGLNILLENTRTGSTLVTQTTNSGEYLVDASQFDKTSFVGDTFRITVTECSGDPKCVKTIQWTGQDELFLLFDLTAVPLPEPEPEPEPEPVVEQEPENSVTPSENKIIATVEAFFGQVVDVKIDDNKLSYFIDGEIEFDSETYDVQEVLFFNAVPETSIADDDFGTEPRLIIEELAVEYRFMFDDHIDISTITEDESLEISFLGNTIEIIKASANEITVRFGTKVGFNEGDTEIVDGNEIKVIAVTENLVSLEVNGIPGSVNLGDSREINGLDVLVDEIIYQGYAGGVKNTILIVGDKVQETYRDGDFFEVFVPDDETWEWIIQLGGVDQYLGVWNVETYQSIDEDEDYKPLAVGESFYLPNDYVEIKFKSITKVDYTKLNFKVRTENEKDYLYVRGTEDDTFSFGTKEYDRLFIDETGIYDEDLVLITTDKVEIGDSDIFLEHGSVKILDWTIELDLSNVLFKTISYLHEDEIFMDYFGIIVEDPEQAIEDKKGLEILVPEERPEVLIVFGKDIPVEVVDEPTVCPEVSPDDSVDPADDVTCEPEIIYETKTVYKDAVCPEEKVCPVAEEGVDWVAVGGGVVIALVISLVAYFGGGLKIYKNRAGGVTMQHRHKGIRGYHDANISHRNKTYRHRKFSEDPLGTLNDVKKIEEEGGLI